MIYGDDNIHDAMEKVALSSALKTRAGEEAGRRARVLLERGRKPEAARRIRQYWAASRGNLDLVGIGASAKRTKAVESMLKSPPRRIQARLGNKSYSLSEALKQSGK